MQTDGKAVLVSADKLGGGKVKAVAEGLKAKDRYTVNAPRNQTTAQSLGALLKSARDIMKRQFFPSVPRIRQSVIGELPLVASARK